MSKTTTVKQQNSKQGKPAPKASVINTHPEVHKITLTRADGSIVKIKSTSSKGIAISTAFNQHNAWLPRKAIANRNVTSAATEGLF